jgi:hypothetical protein
MAKGRLVRCMKCARIEREINEALVGMMRASGAEWKEAKRKGERVLEVKREHELRTGHPIRV